MTFKSPLLQEAHWRGFIHQGTHLEALDGLLAAQKIPMYIGFDATAPSLHVGNLMGIILLRLFQKHGHQPIVLMGDGTTLVGDPSGKDTQRQLLTPEAIDANIENLSQIFGKCLNFSESCPNKALIVRNGDWLKKLNYIEFLRDVGRHFSINRMLTFDSVKLRLDREQPLSFLGRRATAVGVGMSLTALLALVSTPS